MFNIYNDLKIRRLEQRALKSYKIKEIYKKDLSSEKILSFLKNQKLIPFNQIEKILLSSQDNLDPIGIIMIESKLNSVVGFVGTFFSKRTINSKIHFFCNIHSWIVNPSHRLYSFFLISNLIKKNVNLTAFTPIKTLKGLLQKFGLIKNLIEEHFFVNINFSIFKNNSFKIIETNFIKNCINIILKNKQNHKIELKGNIIKKKGFRVFRILYLSNYDLFKNNYQDCLNLISKKYKIIFFSEFILNTSRACMPSSNNLSFKKKKDIYIRSVVNIDKSEILNSDLAF